MTQTEFDQMLVANKVTIHNKRSILFSDVNKLLNVVEKKKFKRWIDGQTGEELEQGFGVYTWDVRRFLECVREGKPTYFD